MNHVKKIIESSFKKKGGCGGTPSYALLKNENKSILGGDHVHSSFHTWTSV